MRAYKNGVLPGETQGYVPTEEVRSGSFIGISHWGVDGHLDGSILDGSILDGSIDDFAIFDGALTSEQILQIYEAGAVDLALC